MLLNSFIFYVLERSVKPGLTLWDAFWLSFTTITTVGYGDVSATTVGGRLATMVLLYSVGLAVFPYVIGQIINLSVENRDLRLRGRIDCRDMVEGHIIIAHFPSVQKVATVIEQLAVDAATAHRPVVIVTDEIETLPFEHRHVHFVHGSPLDSDVLQRANIASAYAAIVLTPRLDARVADATTAATVSLIESLNPAVRTIAECTNTKYLPLFQSCRCDAVLPTEEFSAKLIAKEVQYPGVTPALAELLTNEEKSEIYSEAAGLEGVAFADLATALSQLRTRIIPIGLVRDHQHLLNPPPDTKIGRTDRLILISLERTDWKQIHGQLVAHLAQQRRGA